MSLIEAPTAFVEGAPSGTSRRTAYSFDADSFFAMIEAGVFKPDDRVELWDGWIVEKMAESQPHVGAGIKVTMTLVPLLPPGWCLSPENPVALGLKRVPLPDFAVLRGRGDDFSRRRTESRDVGLLVELAFSSLKDDLGPRLAGYASAGIPVYWVLNLVDSIILVFERPVPAEGRYETSQTYALGQSVPFRLDGVPIAEIPAADLLPIPA